MKFSSAVVAAATFFGFGSASFKFGSATTLDVTFSWEASNVTVCDQPTYVYEAGSFPLSMDKVVETSGYYTQNQPAVSWDATDKDQLYTLFMLDPDAFYCGKGTKIHWMVMNTPGDDLTSGDAVNEFAHPGPPEMRHHRYVFLLHEQQVELRANL
mmetsp:Transcript_36465/g.97446  ORF Transcript_36465/g.97446 Transcript_36465/m.97446 type:complete len:155 (-) Transcript_36465:559-1023(-)